MEMPPCWTSNSESDGVRVCSVQSVHGLPQKSDDFSVESRPTLQPNLLGPPSDGNITPRSTLKPQPPADHSTPPASMWDNTFQALLRQVELRYYQELRLARAEVASNSKIAPNGTKNLQQVVEDTSAWSSSKESSFCLDPEAASPAQQTDVVWPSLNELDEELASPHFSRSATKVTMQRIHERYVKTDSPRRSTVRNVVKGFSARLSDRDAKRTSRWAKHAKMVVHSPIFDGICTTAILMNSTLLGVTTDMAARSLNPDGLPSFFTITDRFFTAWFLLELSLRVFADGVGGFLFGKLWVWNLFDLLVVVTDLVETTASYITGGGSGALKNLTAFRMLRVLRILRALRVIRLIRFFKELRMMVFSVLRSGLSLLWSLILLIIIVFIFGVYLTQNVTFHLAYDVDGKHDEVTYDNFRRYFGSLTVAGYTLFKCVSGGINWGEVGKPLLEIHWSNGLVLSFYVFFVVFAVLNIFTGIFVETAISSAQAERDEVIQEIIHAENSTVSQIKGIFQQADMDKSGTITYDELSQQLECQQVRAHLQTIGLEVEDAKCIYQLLDLDKSGEISIEEFIFGCLKMKGYAKSIDLVSLMHENRRMRIHMIHFIDFVQQRLNSQQDFQDKLQDLFFAPSHLQQPGGQPSRSPWNSSRSI